MDDDPRPPDIRLEQEQELAAPADSSQSPALIGLSPLVASPSPLLDSLAAPASANTTTSAAPPSYPVWDYSLLGPAPESASRAAEAESADDTDTDTVMAQQLARDSGRQTLRSVIASIDSQLAAQRERRNRLRAADAGAAGMLTRQPAPVERLGQPASAWDSEAAPRAQRWDVDDGTLPPDDIEELLGVSREEWRRLAGSDGLSTDDDERDSAAALALASRVPLERARDSEESQQEELFYTSLRAGDESRERRTSTRGAQPPPTTRVTTTATATATSAAPQASRRRPRQDSQDWQVIWADSSSDASSRASSPVVTTYEPDEPLVAEQRRERELSERDAPPATEERTRDARIQANLNAARELVQAAIAARPRPTQVRDAQSAATSTSSSATTAAAATGAGGTASTMTARGATGPPRRQPEIRVFPRGTASSAVSSTNAFTWNPRPRDRTSNVIGERISRAPIATTTTAQGLAAQWPAYRHARLGSLPRLSGAGMWRAQPVMLVYCGKSPDPIGSDDDDTGSCSDEDDFSDEDEDDEDSSSVPRGAKRAYDDQDGLEAAAAARRRRLRAKARETAGTGCGALLCARALDDNSSTRIFPNEGNHNGAGRSRKSAAAAGRPTKGRKPEKVVRSDLAPCPRVAAPVTELEYAGVDDIDADAGVQGTSGRLGREPCGCLYERIGCTVCGNVVGVHVVRACHPCLHAADMDRADLGQPLVSPLSTDESRARATWLLNGDDYSSLAPFAGSNSDDEAHRAVKLYATTQAMFPWHFRRKNVSLAPRFHDLAPARHVADAPSASEVEASHALTRRMRWASPPLYYKDEERELVSSSDWLEPARVTRQREPENELSELVAQMLARRQQQRQRHQQLTTEPPTQEGASSPRPVQLARRTGPWEGVASRAGDESQRRAGATGLGEGWAEEARAASLSRQQWVERTRELTTLYGSTVTDIPRAPLRTPSMRDAANSSAAAPASGLRTTVTRSAPSSEPPSARSTPPPPLFTTGANTLPRGSPRRGARPASTSTTTGTTDNAGGNSAGTAAAAGGGTGAALNRSDALRRRTYWYPQRSEDSLAPTMRPRRSDSFDDDEQDELDLLPVSASNNNSNTTTSIPALRHSGPSYSLPFEMGAARMAAIVARDTANPNSSNNSSSNSNTNGGRRVRPRLEASAVVANERIGR